MTLLKDYLKHSPSTEIGLRSYTADVAKRYPQKPPNEHGLAREVTCHWLIEYQSKTDNVTTLLMLPLMLLGHFHYRRSRLIFTTYHYLTTSEANRLRLTLVMKKILLPMTVLALLASGITLAFGVIMLLVVLFHPPEPHDKRHPEYIVMAFLVILSIFVAALKAQRWFWKMGVPPHTSEFQDQELKLDTASIH